MNRSRTCVARWHGRLAEHGQREIKIPTDSGVSTLIMRMLSFCLIALSVTATGLAERPRSSEFSRKTQTQLRADLQHLASDELKGRSSVDDSIHVAADYVATRMQEIGLNTDLFDGSPMQELSISLGARAGLPENNFLKFELTDDEPITAKFDEAMNPLAIGSASGTVSGGVLFAGYGITAPEFGYDDYSGVDAKGKVVMVIRKEPGMNVPSSKFNGTRNTPHAYFASKIANAIKHGASAIIIINDPTSVLAGVQNERSKIFREQQRKAKIQKEIEQLPAEAKNNRRTFARRINDIDNMIRSLQTDLNRAQKGLLEVGEAGRRIGNRDSIPVATISRQLASSLLKSSTGKSLEELEQQIDKATKPASADLMGIDCTLKIELKPTNAASSNVIGTLAGKGDLADETVVVGAHYDHVGMGGYGSLAPGTIAIHNGADDNASGTSAMLAIARNMVDGLRNVDSHRRFVFIAFTGEERGLLGSKHYVRNPRFPIESTVAMINLDMVGRIRDNELTVYGTGSATGFDELVDRSNQIGQFNLMKVATGYGPSDHQSFYEAGVPVLFFFTGLHNDYHRPTDDFDKIDFGGMARITDTVSAVAHELAIQAERPTYAQTENRVKIRRQMTAFIGVTLSDDDNKVTISGLTPDGPAERSGLRTGDQLVKLGKKSVASSTDVLDFMRGKNPGESLSIEFLRDGTTKQITVELEERP